MKQDLDEKNTDYDNQKELFSGRPGLLLASVSELHYVLLHPRSDHGCGGMRENAGKVFPHHYIDNLLITIMTLLT